MTEFPHVPVVVHQDHGTPRRMPALHSIGFSSVMMDGSLGEDGKTPMDYDYNAGVTRRVVDWHMPAAYRLRGRLAAWAHWKPERRVKKTALALRASSVTTSC